MILQMSLVTIDQFYNNAYDPCLRRNFMTQTLTTHSYDELLHPLFFFELAAYFWQLQLLHMSSTVPGE
jgi:hypothetical protein